MAGCGIQHTWFLCVLDVGHWMFAHKRREKAEGMCNGLQKNHARSTLEKLQYEAACKCSAKIWKFTKIEDFNLFHFASDIVLKKRIFASSLLGKKKTAMTPPPHP